ncbi:uncharacterized protein [Nicotiana tomentosiformis]|uniref:uncharacterized protein n=1 Tax=Nicotiana tomentosiformis TaxID=4098 RepID=UPI00388CB68E
MELSTAFHSQTDDLFKRTIQMIKDMLRACVIDFGGHRDQFLSLANFAYNNSYQSNIQMTLYEAFYGGRCRSSIGWFEPGEARMLGTNFVLYTLEEVKLIQDRLRTAHSRQKSYVNKKVRNIDFMEGKRVLLNVPPMKGVIKFGKKGKLILSMVHLNEYLTYEEEPIAILDRHVQKLRSKDISSVKVLWKGQPIEEAT